MSHMLCPPETDCVVLLYQMMAGHRSAKIERLDIPRVSGKVLKIFTVLLNTIYKQLVICKVPQDEAGLWANPTT